MKKSFLVILFNMKVKQNYKIYLYLLLLAFVSIINLYNAKYLNSLYSSYYLKQTLWFLIGFLIIYFLIKNNIKFIFKYSKYFYYLTNILLLYLLFMGESINGTKAWLTLGPISLQPSEFMKLFLALLLIETNSQNISKKQKLWKNIIYTLIPSVLVFLEPDTGAIIFYLIIFLFALFTLKLKPKVYISLFLLALSGIIGFTLLYFFAKDILIKLIGTSFFYRIERIIKFKSGSYQLELALISIFSSPFLRLGLNDITIYIPEGATDFIFAFSVGNFGLITSFVIIILYFLLASELLKKVKYTQNKKTNYLIISFLLMFICQFTINILMNIGLIPIIGITLPFISYGGSSLLVYFLFIGVILSLTNKDA